MANLRRGERELSLNGTTFTVRLGFNQVAEAERLMGESILDFLDAVTTNQRAIAFHELRALFYASARGQHNIRTVDDAGDVIGDVYLKEGQDVLNELASVLFESLGELFPAAPEQEGKASGG